MEGEAAAVEEGEEGDEVGDYAGFPDLIAAEPDEDEWGEGEGVEGEAEEDVQPQPQQRPPSSRSSSSSSALSPSLSGSPSPSPPRVLVGRVSGEGGGGGGAVERPLVSRPRSVRSAAAVAAESDSSGDEAETGQELRYKNRVGRVPMEWYRASDHIGYSVKGERLQRSTEGGDAIDRFLARLSSSPPGHPGRRSVYDEVNDEWVQLSEEELRALQRLRHGSYAHLSFDPFADYDGGAFSAEVRHEALGNSQEPKRRFIPSKWEAARVVKLVHAMRSGWIRSEEESEEERRRRREAAQAAFLLWGSDGALLQGDEADGVEEQKVGLHRMPPTIPPPKLALPGHAHSYNPPVEYLLSAEEEAAWRMQEPADRPLDFLPRRYSSMRLIPAYEAGVKERFERCLDLYLCPRQRRRKLHIDPNSLIPSLPKPVDLRPFPTGLAVAFRGHTAAVRSLAVHPRGEWLLSGGEDGTVRLWELSTGRCFKRWTFNAEPAQSGSAVVVSHVAFCPDLSRPLISVCVGHCLLLLRTGLGSEEEEAAMDAVITRQSAEEREEEEEKRRRGEDEVEEEGEEHSRRVEAKRPLALWLGRKEKGGRLIGGLSPQPALPSSDRVDEEDGSSAALPGAASLPMSPSASSSAPVLPGADGDAVGRAVLVVELEGQLLHAAWHGGGDYLSTTSRLSSSTSRVLLHRLSTHRSLSPFTRQRGAVQSTAFHPQQPFFFVATLQSVLVYHLTKQTLVKRLLTPAHSISSISLHPSGDHLLLSSLDRRVCWFDLDLSNKPYRTLKYHSRGVRQVAFHPTFPLFASVADDGQLHLFHATTYTDLITNALIVPVKIIAAHPTQSALAVAFHPTQPFAVTAASDGAIRLFV